MYQGMFITVSLPDDVKYKPQNELAPLPWDNNRKIKKMGSLILFYFILSYYKLHVINKLYLNGHCCNFKKQCEKDAM